MSDTDANELIDRFSKFANDAMDKGNTQAAIAYEHCASSLILMLAYPRCTFRRPAMRPMTVEKFHNLGPWEMERPTTILVMCPHCGREYSVRGLKNKLIPTHDYPVPCRSVCPGSQQIPRDVNDRRPLWKDEHD